MKHTPGPWRISGVNVVVVGSEVGPCPVASVYNGKNAYTSDDEQQANAALIARAPTMDIALRSIAVNLALYEKSGEHGFLTLAREAAEKAIAPTSPLTDPPA